MNISNQQNYYNKQNPSFKMTVKFAPVCYANNFMRRMGASLSYREISDEPYNIRSIAKGSNYLFTENICDCNVIGLSNGKNAIMAHLIPCGSNLIGTGNYSKKASLKKNLEKTLQKNIDSLRKNGETIKAFLIGGQIYEQAGRRSISMFKGLSNLLNENDIKPTVVWGQNPISGEMAALYSVRDDVLTLYPKSYSEQTELNPLNVKRYFEILKFNKNDKVLIEDRIQDKRFLSKKESPAVDVLKTNIEKIFGGFCEDF